METIFRDYAPKNVRFYYLYKALAHPELNGYVSPFTLEERLMHIREAERTLGSSIPWICDTMANDVKHALGDAPNSEFVIDPEGRIVRMRTWSDPARLRKDLEELIGPVEKPTQISDLKLERLPPPARPAADGVVPRIELPGRLQPIQVEPVLESTPFYVKLRAEVEPQVLQSGSGKMYLGFHLDPLYKVHFNNLVDPIQWRIATNSEVKISPAAGTGPKVREESDIDPREFLVDVSDVQRGVSLDLTVKYYACTEEWCKPVTQRYAIQLERDRDGGSAMRSREGFSGGRGFPAGRATGRGPGPGNDPFSRALQEITLSEEQATAVSSIRGSMEEKRRELIMERRSSGLDPREMRTAMQEMMQEILEQMRSVLTLEQYQTFEKAFQMPGMRPPPR